MTQRFRVVITDFIAGDLGPERQILGELADLVALDASSEDDLSGKVETADALMLYHNITISRATIERLTNCKLIVRCGVGYDNVDRRFARSRGIPVANVPDYGTEEVADSAIGLTLALTRGLHLLNSIYRAGPDVPVGRADSPVARPGVRGPRPGPDRHGDRSAGQGPRHGRGVFRPVHAGRVRQGPRRPPGRDPRRAIGPGVRPQPAHAPDV